MKTPHTLYSRLALITCITLVTGYAFVYAYTSLTLSDADSGKPLTSTLMQTIMGNVNELNTRVNSLASGWGNLWNTGASNSINYTAGMVGLGSTAGTNAELQIKSGTKPHWGVYQDEATEELRFWNGSNRVVFGSGGNVGIGTADPGAKLEVNGSTIYRNVNANLIARGSAASSSLVFDTSGSVGASALESTNGNLNFLSRSAAGNFGSPDVRMSILNTGNVGIGTTSPTARLDIRGQDQVENHYMAGLIDQNSGDRKIIMRHTITNTNSYYKLSLPQTYSNYDQNGGVVTLRIVWLGRHAIASCNQEYKLVYGTYHTAAPSYLHISQASRMFSQCSPYSYSYTYDQAPDVDFWVDGAGGFLVFNIKWMHVQSTERLINIEILGQTASIPVLSYYGTSLPAGTSALAETILH